MTWLDEIDNISYDEKTEWEILRFPSVDSTNDALKRMGPVEKGHCRVAVACRQTRGRGRQGREFLSPADKGIYMSLCFCPEGSSDQWNGLTTWTVVGMCDAIAAACGVRPGIKWPNDIVLSGKKVGGILTETLMDPETLLPRSVVIGIGVNVLQTEADFTECGLSAKAGSLRQLLGKAPALPCLANEMLGALQKIVDGFPKEKEKYLERYRLDCVTCGKKILLFSETGTQEALAECVEDDFSLKVRYSDGKSERISWGEVSVRGMYGYA